MSRENNSMDKLTVEDILKYVAQGNYIVINDGHVEAIIPEGKESRHDA